jgi:hypothetical protein
VNRKNGSDYQDLILRCIPTPTIRGTGHGLEMADGTKTGAGAARNLCSATAKSTANDGWIQA